MPNAACHPQRAAMTPPRMTPSTEPIEAQAKKPPSNPLRIRCGKCVATIAAPTEP